MMVVLTTGTGSDAQAEQIAIWLDDGSQAPGSTSTGQDYANLRDASWDVPATLENGLSDIGAAVMTVRMVGFNVNGNSRQLTTGGGNGLAVKTGSNNYWMDGINHEGAAFQFTFYSDLAKTDEVSGVGIVFDSLCLRTASSDLALDAFAGFGQLTVDGTFDTSTVSLGDVRMTSQADSMMAFVSDKNLTPENFSGTGWYTVNASQEVVFTEKDTFWVRRKNMSDASDSAFQIGGITFHVYRKGLVNVWLDDGASAPGSTSDGQSFANQRNANWNVYATSENGLADIGAAVMAVRLVSFMSAGYSRESTTGGGSGLSVRSGSNSFWMDALNYEGAAFMLYFYEDLAKTTPITDVNITFKSLCVRTANANLALDVYAGNGGVSLASNPNDSSSVTLGGNVLEYTSDSANSFAEETGLAPSGFSRTGFYTVHGNDTATFQSGDTFWVRRKNTGGASDAAFQLAGLSFTIQRPVSVHDFGAVGDGVTDDIEAVVNAVKSVRADGPGAILTFEAEKTYKLGLRENSIFQIDLLGASHLTINGNGSTLLNTPRQASFRLKHCNGVTVKNFKIKQSPLAFTQGVITNINSVAGTFEMTLMRYFPDLPTDTQRTAMGVDYWDWGAILDPDLKYIRWGTYNHYYINSITNIGPRRYQVTVEPEFASGLAGARNGDVFVQPIQWNYQDRLAAIDGNRYSPNIHVTLSEDCLLEDITLYSGRSSMCNLVDYNYGLITYRNFRVEVPPSEPIRFVSNWRGGFNCKNNRIGPVIENCHFESILDDSINMNQTPVMAAEIVSSTEFKMSPDGWTADEAQFFEGDQVMVFYPPTGVYTGPFTVASVDSDYPEMVTFFSSVPNVVTGTVAGVSATNATQFFNMDMCSRGFVVRGNSFGPQRRHAVLVRSPDGLIEGNAINGVGGNGIILENENVAGCREGPFPQNIVIQSNTVCSQWTPIRIAADSGSICTQPVTNIYITGNTIVAAEEIAIKLDNVRDLLISSNEYLNTNFNFLADPVYQTNSINIMIQ
ncbi:hypothetical protein [Tichowtungia aerotolerans]|uniref:Pectate lyase superfamily protein domain-containing protein n=1 Tax=Tichowtungia aerotolerans TaxID=2697043 RepID=A0A6P1MDG5_9BACT|nr:hypothetical protein [Tichowtungia aerotolerans]QHI69145.1 hypothetical protein GT409_06675 [Tichowtungia aerotolerans]